MIDAIRKKFFSNSDRGNEEMSIENEKQATLAVDNDMADQLKQAQETLVAQAADMQALTELVEEMSTKYTALQSSLAASEAAKASLVLDAKAKQLAARREAIVAAVGSSKVDSLMSATELLSDEQFGAVVGAMSVALNVESKSVMFNEVGISASPVVETKEETAEMKILKARFK